MNSSATKDKKRKKVKRKIRHKSITGRIAGAIFLLFVISLVSLLGYANLVFNNFLYFMEYEPEDNPHILKTINATRLHLMVEGNPDDHNLLGAEMRQALYHMPLGFLGVANFNTSQFPEFFIPDPNNWTPDNLTTQDWWGNLTDVRMEKLRHLGDSPIHTAEYLQGECLRWAVYNRENNAEGKLAAERQISRVLDGYWIQTRASGIPGSLIRYALPNNTFGEADDPNSDDPNRGYYGNICPGSIVSTKWGYHNNLAYDFSEWYVVADTSRDQHVGIMFGLASIINFVENITLQKRAGAIVVELVDNLIKNDWKSIEPLNGNIDSTRTNGADQDAGPFSSWELPAVFLRLAMEVDSEKYTPLYNDALTRLNFLIQQNNYNGYHNVWPSFYPSNLNWEAKWIWWFLEKDSDLQPIILDLLEENYQTIKNMKNSFFQALYLSMNPEGNPTSAASDPLKKTQILREINDSLSRMADDRWNGFNYYQEPDYSELEPYFVENGLIYSNEEHRNQLLMDQEAEEYYNSIPLKEVLEEFMGLSHMKEHTIWSIPVDWRPQEDWIWQRNCYKLRGTDDGNLHEEEYHADFTTIYWWARYMNWIDGPETGLNIVPVTVSHIDISNVWSGHGTLTIISNHTSILEGLLE
ncbi:MAG: hypothetical protein GY870_11720 [archaeon]|nr:hypothetical protein [archaeon]